MKATLPLAVLTAALIAGCTKSTPETAPAPQAGPTAGAPRQAPPAGAPAGGTAAMPAGARPQGADTTQRPGWAPGAEAQPRPYNRVITPEAKTRSGMFKTHMIGSRLYFEIPRAEFGKEMLVVKRAVRVPVNAGYGGMEISPELVVRWNRLGNRVLLRMVSYTTVADTTQPIYQAVRNSNNEIIIGAFNVESWGPDSSSVIEVGRFYTAPPPELGPGSAPSGLSPTPIVRSSTRRSPSRPTSRSRPRSRTRHRRRPAARRRPPTRSHPRRPARPA